MHGELQAGDGVVWLHPELPGAGLASPRTLGGATGSVAVVVDQPYGYREYSARDGEGACGLHEGARLTP